VKRQTFRIGIVAFLVCLVAFNVLSPANVYAWGPEGHEVVALIAANHLTPKASLAVRQLLGNQTLASVANFADAIRQSHPETAQWHFVDIEITDNDFVPSRDCKETNANNEITTGDCVVEAVKHFSEVLADTHQPKAKRITALKFLVHFVGDMHQPLHDADNQDRGGNNVRVNFFGKSSNLHSVWDGGLITKNGLDSSHFADQLDGAVSGSNIAAMQAGDLGDWVIEAHQLAITNAYAIPNNHVIGNPYFQRNMPIVKLQLTRGGLRLARILNQIFR
jgi:hypothetical protein